MTDYVKLLLNADLSVVEKMRTGRMIDEKGGEKTVTLLCHSSDNFESQRDGSGKEEQKFGSDSEQRDVDIIDDCCLLNANGILVLLMHRRFR